MLNSNCLLHVLRYELFLSFFFLLQIKAFLSLNCLLLLTIKLYYIRILCNAHIIFREAPNIRPLKIFGLKKGPKSIFWPFLFWSLKVQSPFLAESFYHRNNKAETAFCDDAIRNCGLKQHVCSVSFIHLKPLHFIATVLAYCTYGCLLRVINIITWMRK